MDQDDERLDRLEDLLQALPVENEPMTVSELDGFVTGLLACPETIPPSDWLSQVWGVTGDAQFPDLATAQETIAAVMAHYNDVAARITQSFWIEPIYEVDANSTDILWEPWVDGFTRAMALRSWAWEALLERADDETCATMAFIMALRDIYAGTSTFSDEEIDRIDQEAPDLIPNCVAMILHQSRPELVGAMPAPLADQPFKSAPRPGRNDPCPCGSGRKYKQCCGKN
jgi:uncharacterized protein